MVYTLSLNLVGNPWSSLLGLPHGFVAWRQFYGSLWLGWLMSPCGPLLPDFFLWCGYGCGWLQVSSLHHLHIDFPSHSTGQTKPKKTCPHSGCSQLHVEHIWKWRKNNNRGSNKIKRKLEENILKTVKLGWDPSNSFQKLPDDKKRRKMETQEYDEKNLQVKNKKF